MSRSIAEADSLCGYLPGTAVLKAIAEGKDVFGSQDIVTRGGKDEVGL